MRTEPETSNHADDLPQLDADDLAREAAADDYVRSHPALFRKAFCAGWNAKRDAEEVG